MSVDLLKRASTKLREHASKATGGNWTAAGAVIPVPGSDLRLVLTRDPADTDYVALMHPPVALALADWLDAEAAWPDEIMVWPGEFGPATAVARAILREVPDA